MRAKALTVMTFLAALAGGCATAPGPVAPPEAPSPAMREGTAATVDGELVLTALSLLGTPYAAGGGSPESGFDCSGFVAYVYERAAQRRLPRNTYDQARSALPVGGTDLRPGDLVFYNTQRRAFSHVGIYLGEGRFVHAPSSGGVVRVEDMRAEYWMRRFDGARRVTF